MSKNNQKTKAKSSVGLKVLTTALVLSTIAGATAVCLTNESVRTTLGIGSEPLQSEKPAENNNTTNSSSELQIQIDKLIDEKAEDLASIKLLESEKANIQSELDSYKASLDSEKELTAEQSLHIAELESAITDKDNQIAILNESIAEKDVQISNLQSIIDDLQNRVDVLEEQIGAVTNSVMDKVNTYEMKYDNTNIMRVFKKNNLVFLSSNYSVEVLNTDTGEQKSIYSDSSSSYFEFYDINDTIYMANGYTFGKYNPDTIEYEEQISVQSAWNKLTGTLESVTNLENGKTLVKTDSCIGILNTDGTWDIYRYQAYKEIGGIKYIVCGDVNTSTNVSIRRVEADGTLTEIYNITTSNINTWYSFNIYDGFAYIGYNTSSSASSAKFDRINLETGEKTTLLTGSTTMYKFEMLVHNDVLFFYQPSCAYTYKFDLTNETMYKLDLVSATSHSTLIDINGYVFDSTLSYVFNDSTGVFQLAKSSKETSTESYYIVDDYIVTQRNARYFDTESLTFKEFEYELSDYSACDDYVQYVNGKLFCSYQSNTTAKSGVFYIDMDTKTIKKVPDSGNGNTLNTGCAYQKSISISDTHALIYGDGTSYKYAVLINTDTMMVEEVFTNFGDNAISFNGKIVSGYGNYIKVLAQSTLEIKTIYSKESLTSLTNLYIENNKIFFGTLNIGYTVVLNLDDYSVECVYGVGGHDVAGLKLAYNGTQSTLFDPTTGDILNIKPYNGTISYYEYEDSIVFIFNTIVYEVLK